LIEALIDVSRDRGCYKVILDCSEANQAFYEKCGLTRKEVQMVSGEAAATFNGPVHCTAARFKQSSRAVACMAVGFKFDERL
jgi:hypothetical protein